MDATVAVNRWNKIVDYYTQYRDVPEQTVQNVWENIFSEVLGYSRLDGEIERRRSITIGASKRAIPDIIIRAEDRDWFVVELKQHNLPFPGEEQLLSYLKLLHLDIGILICEKIYLFDYDYNNNDNGPTKIEIEFRRDNPDGIKFVELFTKTTFHKEAVYEFVQQRRQLEDNISLIRKEITEDLAWQLLREYFEKRYSHNEFDVAKKSLGLILSEINPTQPGDISPKKPQATDLYSGSDGITRGTARELCLKNGINLREPFTFSSKNRGSDKYWANPNVDFLSNSWWLVLNDTPARQLHVFNIPSNSISINQIKTRTDNKNKIDLQIHYGNKSFKDSRSGIKFEAWFVKTISY